MTKEEKLVVINAIAEQPPSLSSLLYRRHRGA